MYIPKRYGESKNSQGVPVCKTHVDKLLGDMKCACGEYLDLKTGKFGPYFTCMNCGNINMRKALDMNPIDQDMAKKKAREEVVRSDDPRYFA
jgi:topoisomerase IA-like protein